MCAGGQTERHCGKVGGRSDELAPANDSPGVYTSGQGIIISSVVIEMHFFRGG